MGCEAILLLMPAHVAWFTSGLNVRGLIADSERPAIYTNGRAALAHLLERRYAAALRRGTRSARLSAEGMELGGRTRRTLLASVATGRKIAADRPFPNIPMANDRLRPLLRELSGFEQARYRDLGKSVAHAVEATARNLARGQTEEEIAGQVGHRLLHRGDRARGGERDRRWPRREVSPAPASPRCRSLRPA